MTNIPWSSLLTEDQLSNLKIFSIIVLCIYGLMIIIIIDTLRLHEFNLKLKSINLYLFYFLALVVCLGQIYSFVILIISLNRDNEWIYEQNFNYGFFSTTISIILIAVQQINSINTATLKTTYVNKYEKGENPSTKKLNKKLMAVNIGTLVIVSLTFIYYAIIIYHLYIDLNTTHENYLKREDVIKNIAWFFGIAMAVSAFAILVSFLFMYNALKQVNLQGSQYKNYLQSGILIIGLTYLVRAVYSLLYIHNKSQIFDDRFIDITFHMFINLAMDLASILVVLFLNRLTIKLRKELEKKQKEKEQELTKRHIKAQETLLKRAQEDQTTENDDLVSHSHIDSQARMNEILEEEIRNMQQIEINQFFIVKNLNSYQKRDKAQSLKLSNEYESDLFQETQEANAYQQDNQSASLGNNTLGLTKPHMGQTSLLLFSDSQEAQTQSNGMQNRQIDRSSIQEI